MGLMTRAAWKASKLTVKYVVVPIALTAFWAAMAEKAQEAMQERHANGAIDPALRPAP